MIINQQQNCYKFPLEFQNIPVISEINSAHNKKESSLLQSVFV